jgi:hypothetical protein
LLKLPAEGADILGVMATWQWLMLAAGIGFAVSAFVGLLLAAVLGNISRDVAAVLEAEPWTLTPPLRSLIDA